MKLTNKNSRCYTNLFIPYILILVTLTSCRPQDALQNTSGGPGAASFEAKTPAEQTAGQPGSRFDGKDSGETEQAIPESLNFKYLLPVPSRISYHTESCDISVENPELISRIWALLLDACDDGAPFYLCLFDQDNSTFEGAAYYFLVQYEEMHTISVLAEEGAKGCVLDFDEIYFGSEETEGSGCIIPFGTKQYCHVLGAGGLGEARVKIEEILQANGF